MAKRLTWEELFGQPMEEEDADELKRDTGRTPPAQPGSRLTRSVWSYFRQSFNVDPSKARKAELTNLMRRLVQEKPVEGLKVAGKRVRLEQGTPRYTQARVTAKRFVTRGGREKGMWRDGKELYPSMRASRSANPERLTYTRYEKWAGRPVTRNALGRFVGGG